MTRPPAVRAVAVAVAVLLQLGLVGCSVAQPNQAPENQEESSPGESSVERPTWPTPAGTTCLELPSVLAAAAFAPLGCAIDIDEYEGIGGIVRSHACYAADTPARYDEAVALAESVSNLPLQYNISAEEGGPSANFKADGGEALQITYWDVAAGNDAFGQNAVCLDYNALP
jgi:hypothetical protein